MRVKHMSVLSSVADYRAKVLNTEESLLKEDIKMAPVRCSLCEFIFQPENRFVRFCDHCKCKNEVYRFGEAI